MIVERTEAEPPSSLVINTFNQHMDNVEIVFLKMERYSLELKGQIDDLKKLVATNRTIITRLQENEQRIKLLLEDSPKQVAPGQELVRLTDDVLKDQGSDESHCHLRGTCKVTNIQEISWTHCKSSTNDGLTREVPQERPYSKAKMLLTSLEDLFRERGGRDQHQALIDKVNRIVKMIENLDMKKSTIRKVAELCKQALTVFFERQKYLLSNGPEMQRSVEHRTRGEQKVVKPKLSNPYL